ncbi:M48 family metalloprotease [Clostridium saudiense]|jgi:hypothetical protein|uniref:M48 family metalloprotease n=2 Tax=Clostridium saudiense TaxID=1414720 RepID=UPI0018AC3B89|nr:M48 family metalloprotease [Clostridium saudiense]
MNIEQQLFNEATINDGGIYFEAEDEILLKRVKSKVNYFITRIINEIPTMPLITVEYVNNENVNAYAFNWKGKYFIGIFTGIVYLLDNLFEQITSDERLYENIYFKDISKEECKEKFLDYCILFLVSHELCHIRFGHCDYVASNGNTFLKEFTTKTLEEKGLESQTLEMDADCCGISTVVNRIIMDSIGINSYEKCINSVYETNFLIFSVYYLFRILAGNCNVKEYSLTELKCMDHPHDGIRQNYILSTVVTLYQKHINEEKFINHLSEVLSELSFHAEKIYQGNIEKERISLLLGFTEVGAKHMKDIINEWNNVRERLLNFSHDELAPCEKFDCEIVLL